MPLPTPTTKVEELLLAIYNAIISEGGLTPMNFAYNDTLTPLPDGLNQDFALTDTPVDTKLNVYYNGQKLTPTADYVATGANIHFNFVPANGSVLQADYIKP